MPLIYSGQEAGLNKRLAFLEKDTINWNLDPSMGQLYSKLVSLKKDNPALWNGLAGGRIEFLKTTDPEKMLAFKRTKGNNTVLVLMNLSTGKLEGKVALEGKKNFKEIFTGKKMNISSESSFKMNPWDYLVFIKN